MPENESATLPHWEQRLNELLPLFGHRNWIVIADAAYPAQSSPGIETLTVDADQLHVVEQTLAAVSACKHVRARIYTDQELDYAADSDAPGILRYRLRLSSMLRGATVLTLPHEEIIHKLDYASQHFRVLIVKTNLMLPYTSVFLELDCGYWSAEAERRLRAAMPA